MVEITRPRGVIPRAQGCPVPAEFAEIAENIDVTKGRFEPWHQPVQLIEFQERVCVAHVRDCCWTGTDVPGARYLDAGLCQKTYLSDGCQRPMVTDSICEPDWTFLGYPLPEPPVAYPDRCADVESGPDIQLRTYRIAYGNECEEGPASCPTEAVKASKDTRIGLLLPPAPDPQWGAKYVYIYRSESLWDTTKGLIGFGENDIETGFTATTLEQDYFLIARLSIDEESWIDDGSGIPDKLLLSHDHLPPKDALSIAGETRRGSLVGYSGQSVWFSERNKYWAYPLKHVHDFPEPVCEVCVCQDSVFVLTGSGVFLLDDNVDCSQTTCRPVLELKDAFAPTLPVSCAQFQGGVLYSSVEGLVYIRPDGSSSLVSSKAFDRDSWRTLGPIRSITIALRHVIISTDQKEVLYPLEFDQDRLLPDDITTLSFKVDQWVEDDKDNLYFLSAGTVYQFDAGAEFLQMRWRQAEQRYAHRSSISAVAGEYLKKNTSNYNTLTVLRDNKVSKVKTLRDKAVRIRGSATRCSQVEIKGSEPMCALAYGQGINRLRRPE